MHLVQVMLSDGDLSSLENMKLNLGLNQLSTRVDTLERSDDPNLVCSLLILLLILLFKLASVCVFCRCWVRIIFRKKFRGTFSSPTI